MFGKESLIVGIHWYNIKKDKLPSPGQEVLISVNGVNYPAVFEAESSTFRTTSEDTGEAIYFPVNAGTIYWTDSIPINYGSG
jgi:hypothetical protein